MDAPQPPSFTAWPRTTRPGSRLVRRCQAIGAMPTRHSLRRGPGHLHDENGQLFSLLAGWTDAAAPDPFVVVAVGRCPFTAEGLLAVADLADRLRARRDGGRGVKPIMP